jgi:hypothetical protein
MNTNTTDSKQKQSISVLWRMYIVLAVVGVVMLVMLGYGYYASHRMIAVYAPLVDAAVEMQLNVTASQLYLERLFEKS